MNHNHVEETIEMLQRKGVRITPQRREILSFLIESDIHPTADEIYQAIGDKFNNMSVATVYNNLRLLTDLKIVKELSYGDQASRFDFITTDHYHAICRNCGKIVDFYYPTLEDVEIVASKLTGFSIDEHRLEVYGLCPDCQKLEDNINENITN